MLVNADNLRAIRKYHSLTTEELASALGCTRVFITHIETGRCALPEHMSKSIISLLDLDAESVAEIVGMHRILAEKAKCLKT